MLHQGVWVADVQLLDLQAGAVPMAVQQQPQAAGPAGAAPQMVFVQAPGTAQPGMQYQYIMPAASGGPSQPAPAGGAWVQVLSEHAIRLCHSQINPLSQSVRLPEVLLSYKPARGMFEAASCRLAAVLQAPVQLRAHK